MGSLKTSAKSVLVDVNSEQKDLQSVIDDLYHQLSELKKDKAKPKVVGVVSGRTIGMS